MIRILLADDHPLLREGLKHLIERQSDMTVVGEVGDGAAALSAIGEDAPDVLVLDVSLPGFSGMEVAERVQRLDSAVKILVLTVHEERAYVTQLLRAGVNGYLLKRSASSELIEALRAVAKGEVYVDPALTPVVVAGYQRAKAETGFVERAALSAREREILIRTAHGYSNKEIASDLAISVKTVETYKARISEKLGLRTRVDMVRFAMLRGWLGEGRILG